MVKGFKKMMVRAAVMSAAVLTIGAFSGCGKTEEEVPQATETQVFLKDMDVDQYVVLGDYKNLKVAQEDVEVSEQDIQDLMDTIYIDSYPAEMGVTDRAVEKGDTANVDFVGKKDGEAFAGGTAQGTNLTIGSGSFIDGFEDGLIGIMPGETVDLDLSFPEVYPNSPDLAGQAVVFTVTVNYIIPAEKTDEAVKNFGDESVTTVEELRQFVYDYLHDYAAQENAALYEEKVLDAFMELCEFKEIPEDMLADYRAKAAANIEAVAANSGTDAETYIYYYYGMDVQSFLDAYSDNALRQNIAMQAVANKEGLRIEDEELNEILSEYATQAGFSSVEEYVGAGSIEEFRDYFMYEKVFAYLVELAGGAN